MKKFFINLPFYILTTLNFSFILLLASEFSLLIDDTDMPWGWQGGGWKYKNLTNYLIHGSFLILIFSTTTFFSIKFYKTNKFKSYLFALAVIFYIICLKLVDFLF